MAEAQLTDQLTRIDSMTNIELRTELKRRGCPTSGNKKDLLAKLRVALQKEYEQTALETASTTSTIDSISLDGRNNNLSNLQQSPVVPFDVNRPSLNNSTASSNSYMTPHGGSPIVYSQHMHAGEIPLTYTNLQIHDQSAGQYPPVYNLTMHQNPHQSPAPMIPVPQQLPISPSEKHQIYDPSLLQQQQQQQQQQQYSPMNTRQQRISVDHLMNTPFSPPVPQATPEKKTRSRSKKLSTDTPLVEVLPSSIPTNLTQAIVQQTMNIEQLLSSASTNVDNGNNIEVNSFVSKSIEEEQKDIDKLRPDRGDSRSPSVDSSSVKSESVIKEIPLSGERHRLSRSKSPKSRWHHSPSPQEQQQPLTNQSTTSESVADSALPTANDSQSAINEQTDKSSTVTLFAEDMIDLDTDEKKSETTQKIELSSTETEKATPQQQLKPSRSQTSSSSLMKSLNRSTTNNRVNLSSDVLKTLIPDISLAPESVINDELESIRNEQNNDNEIDLSSTQPMLETSVDSGLLLSESMTIGDLADQKQQRNRTVVIDTTTDSSSSLKDDLLGNGLDNRRNNSTPALPTRVASYESKALIDGKTNALMMDEPIRVKDASRALEPASQIVYIRGLTRPFTLPLLKELLGRHGTLVEGEFWLDKIKSQCFVMYDTVDDAQNAREALDGCRWPSTNPKILSVRFARQDEFEFSKTHDLPPDQISIDVMDTSSNTRVVQEKSTSVNKISRSPSPDDEPRLINKNVHSTRNNDIREWDIPKLQQEKQKSPPERQVIQESEVKADEPPAKGLDDYFRKTKSKPAIYWLPLTDEQVTERIRRQEQRNAERDEEQRKRQVDENARSSNSKKDPKSRSNHNENTSSKSFHRRSISPKEKRRRVSPSRSPSRRDNKRH